MNTRKGLRSKAIKEALSLFPVNDKFCWNPIMTTLTSSW